MFTITGGDGKEYGPVTTDQVRTWITTGRANLETKAKAVGSEEWRRLGDYAEFGGAAEMPPVMGGQSAAAVGQTEPADRGIRLVAALLDMAIAFVAALPGALFMGAAFLQIVFAASRGQQPDMSEIDPGRLLLGAALLGLATLALGIVQIVMVSTRGQTIGKRICGIRIVRYRDGSKAGFVHGWVMRGFLPALIGAIPWIGMVFTLVDVCFIFREDRRCLHDLIADTKVLKVVKA